MENLNRWPVYRGYYFSNAAWALFGLERRSKSGYLRSSAAKEISTSSCTSAGVKAPTTASAMTGKSVIEQILHNEWHRNVSQFNEKDCREQPRSEPRLNERLRWSHMSSPLSDAPLSLCLSPLQKRLSCYAMQPLLFAGSHIPLCNIWFRISWLSHPYGQTVNQSARPVSTVCFAMKTFRSISQRFRVFVWFVQSGPDIPAQRRNLSMPTTRGFRDCLSKNADFWAFSLS